jgi:hypothetical protein
VLGDMDVERIQTHLGPTLIHAVRVFARPRHRRAVNDACDLGAVDLSSSFVDQDPVLEHREMLRISFTCLDGLAISVTAFR